MVARAKVPKRGDIVWLQFDPQEGREQSGKRPAIILSPRKYNKAVGLAIACPITQQAKGYPFEAALPDSLKVSGVVLADHVKSVDWKARRAKFICKAPDEVIGEVLAKLKPLIAVADG